eukprot:Gregarina_sp_Poly_1__143@NODE_1031_length_5291_cov_107_018185_g716_i0_p2_GENE_NODE_1031_length_5291_cov_107_018185_g716_i0NODE_1031_length_5291_cov_107_018185_g716_i0_p2_ORF_typecomplete_len231_score28_12KH_8/PF17903_1/1_4e32KH_1/PF00013_29/0_00013KH_4/PF13083_6/0_051_NODE_1031_length_5291_cov_107_018185_g716_i013142006
MTDGAIDYWKEPEFTSSCNSHAFVTESDFKIVFPAYRSQYIQETWPRVKNALNVCRLKCDLDLVNKTMTVATTNKTRDPYVIIKARDMLNLIARSVPLHQAKRVLNDDMFCDIIKIGGIVRNSERFSRRRQRLIGPNGATLKALELLTGCYVCVSGQTVAAIGTSKGLKKVRQIALDCMENIHPVYHLKTMMIQEELQKDDSMKSADWERYLPHFKKTNPKKRKRTGSRV